jgi:Nif-specific regulatory protein
LNAKLLAVAGLLKDSSFAVPTGEMPIGRDSSNLLAIRDPSLSRRHCVLVSSGDSFTIRDLKSRNGTVVNGIPIEERQLEHGDQISLGDSIFVFQLRDEIVDTPSDHVEFRDSRVQATVQLHPQDAVYADPNKILQALPARNRAPASLNALLRISRVVHSIPGLDELQNQILQLIFEVVPADRGAILLDRHTNNTFSSVFARHRIAGSKQQVQVSSTVVDQVMTTGVAVLASDVVASQSLSEVDSLVRSQVCSVLCVPLTVHEKLNGCLYLDSSSASARLDEEHLQLVTAVAGTSAIALQNARRIQSLESENARLSAEIRLDHNLVGSSPRMKEVYQFLAKVSRVDSTVLLQGESGTGKELAARAIHRNSPRSHKPFVAINCAAIPEGLLESELFGHERGSFTGALALKRGRLEVANGGVVFLDEIGELALPLQVKLLRVLQEHECDRVGATRSIPIDVRIVAATNRNLEEAVKAGIFRQDLFYRLNVLTLTMPSLRERRDDIPTLANYFVSKLVSRGIGTSKEFSPEAMDCLVSYDWPGNVRELENAIERALVLSTSEMITPDDLPESTFDATLPSSKGPLFHARVQETKRQLIVDAVERSGGNYTEAAQILGVHPNYLHRLIRNLGIREATRSASKARRM